MTSRCSHLVRAKNSPTIGLQLSPIWIRLSLALLLVPNLTMQDSAAEGMATKTYTLDGKAKSHSPPDVDLAVDDKEARKGTLKWEKGLGSDYSPAEDIWVCTKGRGTFEMKGDIGTGFYKWGNSHRSAFFKYEGYGEMNNTTKHPGWLYKEAGVKRYWFLAKTPRPGDGLFYVVYTTTLWGNFTFHCLAE